MNVTQRRQDPFLHMFTSRTTGKAKSVAVPNKALMAFKVYMKYAAESRTLRRDVHERHQRIRDREIIREMMLDQVDDLVAERIPKLGVFDGAAVETILVGPRFIDGVNGEAEYRLTRRWQDGSLMVHNPGALSSLPPLQPRLTGNIPLARVARCSRRKTMR